MKNENKQPEKDMRDASHFEILSNVVGKEQDGIDMPILKLWGEVENFYGDLHKNETGRQLLLRIQEEYNISFKPLIVPKGYWNCGGCEMDYDARSLGDDSKCPVCNITCDMVLVEDHPTMAEPESKEVESVPVKSFKAVQSCANSIDIVEIFDENERTITEIISAVEYVTTSNWKDANMIVNSLNASQFKTNPIEVIKKRLSELEMDKSSYTYAEYETKIYELTHILKLIQ